MAKSEVNFHEVKIPRAILSFPKLHEADSYKGSKPKFGATFLIEKSEDISGIKKAIAAIMADTHGGQKYGALEKNNRCFGDGNTQAFDGYAERFFLKGKNPKRIPCIDVKSKEFIHTTEESEADRLYAGCIVAAKVSLYGYEGGIACAIHSIAKLGDGERMGGAGDVMAEYEDEIASYEDAEAGSVEGSDVGVDLDF